MLQNKTIIVIGASGLIGQEIVRLCLDQGAFVIAAQRNLKKEGFDNLSDDVSARLHFMTVDVTSEQSVLDLIDGSVEKFGQIHGVVNSSWPRNEHFGTRFEDIKLKHFNDNIAKHLGGAFNVCQKLAEYFAAQGGGTIINFASIYGIMAPRFELYEGTSMTKEVEYVLSKAAIVHFTQYLAKYYKGKGVRVNCVSPGGIENEQNPLFLERYNQHCMSKGMLNGEDIAGTVLFLLSDLSSYINGQNIVVDDGFSL